MLSKNEKIYISLLIFLLLLSCLLLINCYKNRKESYVEIIKNPKIHIIYFSGDLISQNDKDIKLPQDFTEKIEKIVNTHKNELSLCTIHKYNPIIISANINQDIWNDLGKYIANLYDSYDSFVIIHGKDTISYTGSALSVMFRNLKKSIILTTIEDLYISLKYASISKLPVVAVSNEGNIYNAEYFTHESEFGNLEKNKLANILKNGNNIDIEILYNTKNLSGRVVEGNTTTLKTLNPSINISIFKLYPNISGKKFKESILNLKCHALILQLYSNGNTQTDKEFLISLRELVDSGILIVAYVNSKNPLISLDLIKCGVILGKNYSILDDNDKIVDSIDSSTSSILLTLETLYAKLLYLLSYNGNMQKIRELIK